MRKAHVGVLVLVLAAAGCILLVLGTFLPYISYGKGDDYAVVDLDHLGTTWAGGLSYLAAVAAIPVVAFLSYRSPRVLGAFLVGLGLVVSLDFLGAFIILPTTYTTSTELRWGGVLGAIGGALLVAAGLVSALTTSAASDSVDPSPGHADPSHAGKRRSYLGVYAVVSVNATLGMVAVLFGDFADPGDLAVKALGSSLCVTAGILVALGCVPALRRGSLKPVPLAGVALSAAGFSLLLAGIWGQWPSAQFWKIAATLVVTAVACAWGSLLSRAGLPSPHLLRVVSLVAVLASCVANIAAIWALTSSGQFWRMYGVIGLVLVATTTAAIVAGGSRRADAVPAGL